MSDNESTTQTMADVSHTHPYTGETSGHLFRRGPTVAADGGQRRSDGGDPRSDDDRDPSTGSSGTDADSSTGTQMKDVDHTPPRDAGDANGVFERGSEHDETVSVDFEADE